MYSIRPSLLRCDKFDSITFMDVVNKNDRKKYVIDKLRNFEGNILHIDMGSMIFTNDIAKHIPTNVKHVWTLNNTCDDDRVHTYPCGIIDLNGELENKFGSNILENKKQEKTIDIYVPRSELDNDQKLIGIPCGYHPTINENHIDNLFKSKMVVCCSGISPDTFTFWETLIAGAIPIVWGDNVNGIGSGWYWKNFKDMIPMINITHPDQLEYEYLMAQYKTIQNKNWDYSFLNPDFWIDKILS